MGRPPKSIVLKFTLPMTAVQLYFLSGKKYSFLFLYRYGCWLYCQRGGGEGGFRWEILWISTLTRTNVRFTKAWIDCAWLYHWLRNVMTVQLLVRNSVRQPLRRLWVQRISLLIIRGVSSGRDRVSEKSRWNRHPRLKKIIKNQPSLKHCQRPFFAAWAWNSAENFSKLGEKKKRETR